MDIDRAGGPIWRLPGDDNSDTPPLIRDFSVGTERVDHDLGQVVESACLGVATGSEFDGREWILVCRIESDPVNVRLGICRCGVRDIEARPRRLVIKGCLLGRVRIDQLQQDASGCIPITGIVVVNRVPTDSLLILSAVTT